MNSIAGWRWRQSSDLVRLALVNLYDRGFNCQENDPEGSFTLFTRGRDEAIRLNEPWWVWFFEDWRLAAISSYVSDFTRAQPLAMELMARLGAEPGRAVAQRNSILTNALYTLFGSSRNRVGGFQSFGSIQVSIFSRKYSSSR